MESLNRIVINEMMVHETCKSYTRDHLKSMVIEGLRLINRKVRDPFAYTENQMKQVDCATFYNAILEGVQSTGVGG